jgi:phosphatidylglycerophosphate synthase
MYEYNKSIKSSISDELINTYGLRPIAGLVVQSLYKTQVTPNQVTIASIIAGLIAAALYTNDSHVTIACAGLLVTLKDVLDSADGQLARAKQQYTRSGRFLDSIGDFLVNATIFSAIGYTLSTRHGSWEYGIFALLGLVGITFRVSYHVFYQVSFLHSEQKYQSNRITEEVREEDRSEDRFTLTLQNVFQKIYGWQDKLIVRIDGWSMGRQSSEKFRKKWYTDIAGIRMSGFLGMGTELFLLTVCSIFNRMEFYLSLNVVLLNGILFLNIAYRRVVLRRKLLLVEERPAR